MEIIETIVMADEVWSAMTLETAGGAISNRQQIQNGREQIIGCVVTGRLTVDDLRQLARWTNTLAHEVVEVVERGSAQGEEEQLEVSARRLLHGSVSAALGAVRTEGRVGTQRVKQARRYRSPSITMPGMGNLEKKDREARSGFSERA